ncbi:MAG: acyl-CoA dehydrogenase, partial [Myxococcota bacterium]|nr:acyl-CoA dehydrogenase [Myxococcota bacterium]
VATACPSTALAYFFHSSAVSRGLLAVEAADAGLFSDPRDEAAVRSFGRKILSRMGSGHYMANFGSETVKSSKGAVAISTEAKRVEGGYLLNGVKSFGCNTGVADWYVVTAKLEGAETAEGIVTFMVERESKGLSERHRWNAIGMRATATHGIILEDVFVPDDESLVVPAAFLKMMEMSRGSMVGNQLAGIACYLGAAQATYDYALKFLMETKFRDTGAPLATSPLHQQLIGQMSADLETAYLWLRRQLELETSEPALLPKSEVVAQWRRCKGEVTEACFRVGQGALKACGTTNTADDGPSARAIRNLSMGLVQAFPAERGRLEVAKTIVEGQGTTTFTPN